MGMIPLALGGASSYGGCQLSDENPNPNGWNRSYTSGTGGRSPVMLWLGVTFVLVVLGLGLWSYVAG